MSSASQGGKQTSPQRFQTAYILFSVSRHAELRKEYRDKGLQIKTPDITKMVAAEWRSMTPEDKEPWESKSKVDRARYEAEKAELVAAGKVAPSGSKRKRLLKDKDAPKRPTSAYFSFANERRAEMKRQHPNATNGELSKLLSTSWKSAPEEVRSVYLEAAALSQAKYKADLLAWKKAKAAESKGNRKKQRAADEDSSGGQYDQKKPGTRKGPRDGGRSVTSPSSQRAATDVSRFNASGNPNAGLEALSNEASASAMMPVDSGRMNLETLQQQAAAPVGLGLGAGGALDSLTGQLPPTSFLQQNAGLGGVQFGGLPGGDSSSLLQDPGQLSHLRALLGQQGGDLGGLMNPTSGLGAAQQLRMSELLGAGAGSVTGAPATDSVSSYLASLQQQQMLQRQILAGTDPLRFNGLQSSLLPQGQGMLGGVGALGDPAAALQLSGTNDALSSSLLSMMANNRDDTAQAAAGLSGLAAGQLDMSGGGSGGALPQGLLSQQQEQTINQQLIQRALAENQNTRVSLLQQLLQNQPGQGGKDGEALPPGSNQDAAGGPASNLSNGWLQSNGGAAE